MNRLVRLGFVFGLMTGAVLPLQAETDKVTNVPDSVSLFSYARADGQSGLRFAWSPDGEQWLSVADGYDYVKCDFGPWGREKKMFAPHLWQNASDGSWHCVWTATRSGKVLAHAASPDLLKWGAQSYFTEADRRKYEPASAFPTKAVQVTVDGKQADGWMQRVPYAVVEQLIRYAEHKKYRQQLYDERAEQDPVRFAGLKPVTASIEVHASEGKAISDHLIGIFFEDINYAADGGLYAELVQNRDFEYSPKDGSHQKWNSDYAWSVAGGEGSLSVATDAPIHENNPHYAVLDIKQSGAALQNDGFDGITLKKGEKYDFSCFARIAAGSKGGKVEVSLLDENGKTVGMASVKVTSPKWKTQKAVLVAKADVAAAKLALRPEEAGTYHSTWFHSSRSRRSRDVRTDFVPTWPKRWPTCIRVLCVSPAAVWPMATALTTSTTGRAPSVRWRPASLCAICGDIIRHADWDTLSISSSARISVPNLYPWLRPAFLARIPVRAAIIPRMNLAATASREAFRWTKCPLTCRMCST